MKSREQTVAPTEIRDQGRSAARVSRDTARVKALLHDLVESDEADRWMSVPNAMLGGVRPDDVIQHGETDRVLEVLARIQEGIYV